MSRRFDHLLLSNGSFYHCCVDIFWPASQNVVGNELLGGRLLLLLLLLGVAAVGLEAACWWHQASGEKDNVASIKQLGELITQGLSPSLRYHLSASRQNSLHSKSFFMERKMKPFPLCTGWGVHVPEMPTGISGKIKVLCFILSQLLSSYV